MKKQIETLKDIVKPTLTADGSNIKPKGEELNDAYVAQLREQDDVFKDFDIDSLNKMMSFTSDFSNATMAAASELSAEAMKNDAELDDMALKANVGKNVTLEAGWARSKTFATRDMKTGETTGEVTNYNQMSGGRMVIAGVGSKAVRDRAKEYGKELLGQ